jgi:solute:Na+ symporter, SSS family
VASDATDVQPETLRKRIGWIQRIVGVDEEFSRSDRWITYGIFFWSITWFAVFVIGSMVYLIHPWSNAIWADYWLVTGIFLPLLIGIATTIWFTIGCWHDMRVFFRRLRQEQVDAHDDGSVCHTSEAMGSSDSRKDHSHRTTTAADTEAVDVI